MVRLGVLGVGTIARCVLEGLCSAFKEDKCPEGLESTIYISERGHTHSQALKDNFPDFVEIKPVPEIVENCDWLVLAVRPEQVEDLCKDLTFREDQIVFNFVSVVLSEEDAHRFLAPAKQVIRISPWPCSKNRLGPILVLNSPGGLPEETLALVGDVVKVETIDQFLSMQSASCFMASFYQALENLTQWLESENIEREKASLFIGSLVHAFAHDAKAQEGHGFAEITAESQTPGGMNQKVLTLLKEANAFNALPDALTKLVDDIRKK